MRHKDWKETVSFASRISRYFILFHLFKVFKWGSILKDWREGDFVSDLSQKVSSEVLKMERKGLSDPKIFFYQVQIFEWKNFIGRILNKKSVLSLTHIYETIQTIYYSEI